MFFFKKKSIRFSFSLIFIKKKNGLLQYCHVILKINRVDMREYCTRITVVRHDSHPPRIFNIWQFSF